jgi:predicted acylesterase/phospholipase RssA
MIDTLILSGGGLKGFGFIGALKVLEENNIIKIKNIKNYYANSVGTIISLLLAIGYNLNFLEEFIIKFDFKKIIPKMDLSSLFNDLGISNGNEIMIILQTMFLKKTKQNDMSFSEYYKKYKIKLNFITTNYTLGKEEVLSVEATPELSILLAVRMSISIPLIFTPVIYNNNIFVDGFLVNNFPIDKININENNYIAIKVLNDYNKNNPNLLDFIKGCLNLSIYNISRNQNELKNNKVIEILYNNINEIDIDNTNIITMNTIGKNIINNYLSKPNKFIENIKLFNYIENFTKNNINNAIYNINNAINFSS